MRKLYFNGTILTMEEASSHAAFLITKDDRIEYVGNVPGELAALCEEQIDLDGHCLLPGFIDAHSHFLSLATSLMQVSLDGAQSWEDIVRRIAAFLSAHSLKEGAWITANGYDHNLLREGTHPSRTMLDSVCPDHPLVLQHSSGHMGVFNTAALNALGLREEVDFGDGGRFDYESGLMEENAFFRYLKKMPMPGLDAILDACREAQNIYASYGITTMQEGMLVKEMLPLYQAILASGLLKLDVIAYADVRDAQPLYAAFPSTQPHFRLGGLKIFLDGSPQGRTAWMRSPYQGSDDCGYGTMSDEAVCAALELAAKENLQLIAHCNGDAACAQFLQALEQTEQKYPALSQLRPVIVHAQLLGLDQLPAVEHCGAIPSFFIAHIHHWGDIHMENFGRERASKISPARSALSHHLPITFHQDTPVIPPDMLESICCAVTRTTKNGVLLGPDERISPMDALKAVTKNAAYQYFEEDNKGSLSPGKKADLVILDKNPLLVPKDALSHIHVLETIKDGCTVYRRAACNSPV